MEKRTRVRFAPSPTGPLHIGGVRTALFNYLFAKKVGGDFLVRIEDTDRNRFVEGAEQYIKESLEWCGIMADESPWSAGEKAPYRQSERKEMYGQYAQQLLDSGKAYIAFDTPEELDQMRQQMSERGETFQYNAVTRMRLKNSLTLSEEEVKGRIAAGAPYSIRIKMPVKEVVRLEDMVRGTVKVHTHTLDDKVIMKADGMPTYHLANVVDDYLMGITHVIRGEEWLPSAPLHVLLYRFLGWEKDMPQFAHLPLLLKPSGKGKLSKRDGEKGGFPIFPIQWQDPSSQQTAAGYREAGFLPEAFINFLALLGWSPSKDRELFSLEELIGLFSIEKVGKSGTKFDYEKAQWFNQQYLKNKTEKELGLLLLQILEKSNISCTPEKAEQIAGLMKERIVFPQEMYTTATYFFEPPKDYDEKVIRKKWNAEVATVLQAYQAELNAFEGYFTADTAKDLLNGVLEAQGVKMGKIMQVLRVAVTGAAGGPDLMPTLALIGKEEVAQRIGNALDRIGTAAP